MNCLRFWSVSAIVGVIPLGILLLGWILIVGKTLDGTALGEAVEELMTGMVETLQRTEEYAKSLHMGVNTPRLGAVGRLRGKTELEHAETIQHYLHASLEGIGDLGEKGSDHCHDVWLGYGTLGTDALCQLVDVDGANGGCVGIPLAKHCTLTKILIQLVKHND